MTLAALSQTTHAALQARYEKVQHQVSLGIDAEKKRNRADLAAICELAMPFIDSQIARVEAEGRACGEEFGTGFNPAAEAPLAALKAARAKVRHYLTCPGATTPDPIGVLKYLFGEYTAATPATTAQEIKPVAPKVRTAASLAMAV